MRNEFKAGGSGLLAGFFISLILQIAFGITPKQITEKLCQEAVASGHAEWIIETNESGEPEMKFQWKQLK